MRMYLQDLNDPEVLYKHVSKVCNVQWFDDKCQPLNDELSALADRYTEYAMMCRVGGEKPMAYTEWLEFDKLYLEHIRTAPNPLSPPTFQRMQEVNKQDSKRSDQPSGTSVNHLQQEVTRLKYLVEDLEGQRDRAIHFKSEAEKETNRLGQELLKRTTVQDNDFSDRQLLAATAISEGYSYEELCAIRTELRAENAKLTNECDLAMRFKREAEAETNRLDKQMIADKQSYSDEDYENLLAIHDELVKENEEMIAELSDSGQRKTPANQPLYPHYYRDVSQLTHIDVYWVLQAWSVNNPSVQHAVKKLLAAGQRGAKDTLQDLNEARNSISRAIELETSTTVVSDQKTSAARTT